MSGVSAFHMFDVCGEVCKSKAAAAWAHGGYTAGLRHRLCPSCWLHWDKQIYHSPQIRQTWIKCYPSYLFIDYLQIIRGRWRSKQKNDPKEHRRERKTSGHWYQM